MVSDSGGIYPRYLELIPQAMEKSSLLRPPVYCAKIGNGKRFRITCQMRGHAAINYISDSGSSSGEKNVNSTRYQTRFIDPILVNQ